MAIPGTPEGDGVRVLLVGDSIIRHVSDELELGQPSFTVVTATSAREAIDQLESDGIDCLVSAYDLADSDGLSLLQTVRASKPVLPAILCPQNGSEALAGEAVAAGANGYLPIDTNSELDQVAVLADRIEATIRRTRQQATVEWVHERYQRLIQYSTDVVFVVGAAGAFQYVSPAVEVVLGYDPDALVGENGFELVHPEDREATMAEFFDAWIIQTTGRRSSSVPNTAMAPGDGLRSVVETSWTILSSRGSS